MDARPHLLRDERGTTLLEVIVAAVVLVVISGSVTSMVIAAQTGSGQQRIQAIAADLAQSTLEELRSRKFTHLTGLNATTTVTAGGVTFSVHSSSEWEMQAPAGSTSCAEARGRPETLKVSARVTWPEMKRAPVVVDTLVAAPLGVSSTRGNHVVQIANAQGIGVGGISVTLGPLSRATDSTGCVRFAGVAAGRYTLSFSRPNSITPAGVSAVSQDVDVVASETTSSTFEYDAAGTAAIRFVATAGTPAPATAGMQGAVLDGVGMNGTWTATPAGTRVADADVPGLYPSATAYQVFPDSCQSGLPSTAGVLVPSGGVTTPRVQIPVPVLRFDLKQVPNNVAIGAEAVSMCGTRFVLPTVVTGGNVDLAMALPGGTLNYACFHYSSSGREYWRRWNAQVLGYPGATLAATARTNDSSMQNGTVAERCTR
jgi:Tfp pilus assembly protein PilV